MDPGVKKAVLPYSFPDSLSKGDILYEIANLMTVIFSQRINSGSFHKNKNECQGCKAPNLFDTPKDQNRPHLSKFSNK